MNIISSVFLAMLCVIVCSACHHHRSRQSNATAVHIEMERLCSRYGFPGMTVAWAADGVLHGSAATGWADVERRMPMNPTTRMLAASIGKSFVGALCIALDQEGQLSLDQPIARWLGEESWFQRLPNHDSITLRHLLTHTAGLPDHVHTAAFSRAFSVAWPSGRNHFAPDDLVAFVLDEPPLFPAGQGWSYSDTGYIVAGLVIEAATGGSLFLQIRDRFLNPLNLGDTMPSDRRDLPGLAAGYPCPDNPFGFPAKSMDSEGRLLWHPGVEWAGGGLISSSPDLAMWGASLFTQGSQAEVPLEQLLATVPMSSADPCRRYGLGIGITSGGPNGPVYGHAGWIPGYISSLRHYPDYRLTLAIQVNTDIGIADSERDVLGLIEMRLLQTVLAGDR